MDETILKITVARLRRWDGQPIDQKKLESLREEIYTKTKTNKFAPFSNIKKWIKAGRKEMAKKDKEMAKKAGAAAKAKPRAAEPVREAVTSSKVQHSMDEIKTEMLPEPPQEVSMPKPAIVFDKVYLQTITYEMASMRQALDRIGRQLDKLERELNAHRES
jgi:leucyl aminopeptidase (aminopeptidase T)